MLHHLFLGRLEKFKAIIKATLKLHYLGLQTVLSLIE